MPPTWRWERWGDGMTCGWSWNPACFPRSHEQTNLTGALRVWDQYWTKLLHCRRKQSLLGNCSQNNSQQIGRQPLQLRGKIGWGGAGNCPTPPPTGPHFCGAHFVWYRLPCYCGHSALTCSWFWIVILKFYQKNPFKMSESYIIMVYVRVTNSKTKGHMENKRNLALLLF